MPPFLTDERLRLCWEHVAHIRSLLPQAYLKLDKGQHHDFDAHPMQYAVPLLTLALRLACFYREPNPMARKLAARMTGRLAEYIKCWALSKTLVLPTLIQQLDTLPGSVSSALHDTLSTHRPQFYCAPFCATGFRLAPRIQ